ncbi:uracil-DNA glycosylase [Halobacteriales archaeon Cl-PHB]
MPAFPDDTDRTVLAADCEKCPGLVESRTCISWGNGPLDAEVVVVGEAPGAGDAEADRWQGGNHTGMAYTSRHSGRRIRDLLESAGFGPESAYFTNAVKCHPAENRDPTEGERANCRPFLREEIRTVEPVAVVTTESHTTESIFAHEGIAFEGIIPAVLDPVDCPTFETTAVPVLHPSYRDVWRSRLGYSAEEYREAVAETLADVVQR